MTNEDNNHKSKRLNQEALGSNTLEPLALSQNDQELCNLLDSKLSVIFGENNIKSKMLPSDMLKGALWAMRDKNNPDRIAQAAHSIREILRPFKMHLENEIQAIYYYFQNITHHGHNVDIIEFQKKMEQFKAIMATALGQEKHHNHAHKIQEHTSDNILEPLVLSANDQELCKLLDARLFALYGGNYGTKLFASNLPPSDMLKGSLWAIRSENIHNPDLIAQAANSMREILYRAETKFDTHIKNRTFRILHKKEKRSIFILYKYFESAAHHENNADIVEFKGKLEEFNKLMFNVLSEYDRLYAKIDDILTNGPGMANKAKIPQEFFTDNNAFAYFLWKADKRWINWLEKNGLLSARINKNQEHSYAEIDYLQNMTESNPREVSEILCEIHNPKKLKGFIVRIFVEICGDLPIDKLEILVPKLCQEKWLRIAVQENYAIKPLNIILDKLHENKCYESLKQVYNAVLTVKITPHTKSGRQINSENFEIDMTELRATKVFDNLINIKDTKFREMALNILAEKVNKIIMQYHATIKQNIDREKHMFCYYDPLGDISLDLSFVSPKISIGSFTRKYDGLRYLLFAIKRIMEDAINEYHKDPKKAISLYQNFIGNFRDDQTKLVDSPATYRLRIYLISLSPHEFRNQIEEYVFRIFTGDVFSASIVSEEYFVFIKNSFSLLEGAKKNTFINELLSLYKNYDSQTKHLAKIRIEGVLGMLEYFIQSSFETKELIHKSGLTSDYAYTPRPNNAWQYECRWNPSRASITQEEFSEMSIPEVAYQLKKEWTEEKLLEMPRGSDPFEIIDAEGFSQLLIHDISTRFNEYCNNYRLFLEEHLHTRYKCAYIDGLTKYLELIPIQLQESSLDNIVYLCNSIIRTYYDKTLWGQSTGGSNNQCFLADRMILMNAVELLDKIITPQTINKYRELIIQILELLLYEGYKVTKQEARELAARRNIFDMEEYECIDPFTIPANRILLNAFRILLKLVEIDSRNFNSKAEITINNDIKIMYEQLLANKKTHAIMFMLGQHLHLFYIRDKKWILGLIDKIFPTDAEDHHLYIVAWEGFISGRVCLDLFSEPKIQELYSRGLDLHTDKFLSHQNNFVEHMNKLAENIAWVHLHSREFNNNHSLYKKFWKQSSPDMQKYFIDFWRRHINAPIDNNFWQKRVEEIWELAIDLYDDENSSLIEFDDLIDYKRNKLDPLWIANMTKRVLQKTKGKLTWYHNLTQNIVELSKIAPEDSVEIINMSLISSSTNNSKNFQALGGTGKEWKEAILYLRKKKIVRAEKLYQETIKLYGAMFLDT